MSETIIIPKRANSRHNISLAWGVFQAYYKEHVFPNESETTLSLLGSLQNGVSSRLEVGAKIEQYGLGDDIYSFRQWETG